MSEAIELYAEPIIKDHDYGVVQKDYSPMVSTVEVDGKEAQVFEAPDATDQARIWAIKKIGRIIKDM